MPGCNKICTEAMDQTHLLRPKIFSGSEANKSYTHEVIIDPDNLMAKVWKERFKKTCERYSDVINPNPGRYNSYYGNVDCTIDFCSTPPPSVKARLPNYSTEKLKIMAELMDKCIYIAVYVFLKRCLTFECLNTRKSGEKYLHSA